MTIEKVPQTIKDKLEAAQKAHRRYKKLQDEIMIWLEEKGVDTGDQRFVDGILSRLSYAEFADADEFERDLLAYIAGEKVGYG